MKCSYWWESSLWPFNFIQMTKKKCRLAIWNSWLIAEILFCLRKKKKKKHLFPPLPLSLNCWIWRTYSAFCSVISQLLNSVSRGNSIWYKGIESMRGAWRFVICGWTEWPPCPGRIAAVQDAESPGTTCLADPLICQPVFVNTGIVSQWRFPETSLISIKD